MTYIDLLYTHIHKQVRYDLGYNAGTYDAATIFSAKRTAKLRLRTYQLYLVIWLDARYLIGPKNTNGNPHRNRYYLYVMELFF